MTALVETPFVESARQLVYGLECTDRATGAIAFRHYGRLLAWRHHGLGMLQAEFSEALRIHIWHPRLVSSGMAWPRCGHDHRFDIASAVILGTVIDIPCDVERTGYRTPLEQGWANVDVYEIEHAKNQDRLVEKGCSTATTARKLAQGSVYRRSDRPYAAGSEYRILRRYFHTTRVEALAITVVHRSNFDDKLARVLCAPDSDVTAVSGIVRDESPEHQSIVNEVLTEAAAAIAAQAGDP
jgi:hypothetical protein